MTLEPFSLVLFMESAKALNRKASAKFARRQAFIGRPVPKGPNDPRPDPGCMDCEEIEG